MPHSPSTIFDRRQFDPDPVRMIRTGAFFNATIIRMSNNTFAFLILVVGGVTLTIGDIIFKYWLGHSRTSLYVIGFLLYAIALVLLIESYKFDNIAVASSILDVSNVVILAVVSWAVFEEPLSLVQMLGVLASMIGLFLLQVG
jgi:multidrug transporter EmrE-like cation transporter